VALDGAASGHYAELANAETSKQVGHEEVPTMPSRVAPQSESSHYEANHSHEATGTPEEVAVRGPCRTTSADDNGKAIAGAPSLESNSATQAQGVESLGSPCSRREAPGRPATREQTCGGSFASLGTRLEVVLGTKADMCLKGGFHASDYEDVDEDVEEPDAYGEEDKDDSDIVSGDDDDYRPLQNSKRQPPPKRRKISTHPRPPARIPPRKAGNACLPRRLPSPLPSLCFGAEAVFDEWPLQNASLKRVTEGSRTTFQLQFAWEPCRANHEREGQGTKRLRMSNSVVARRCTAQFTPDEDAFITKLKRDGSLSWDEIHRRFSSEFPGHRSKAALQVRYSKKLNRVVQGFSSGRGRARYPVASRML
jgi:hypothetical protein